MRNKIILSLLMTGLAVQADAQAGFVSQSTSLTYNVFDQNGKSFDNPLPDVAGSPFLKDEWRLGYVVLTDNRRFDSVKIRLNLLSQEVHFLNKDNKEIALAQGYIKEIAWPNVPGAITGGTKFRCGFPPVDALDAGNFYEVLAEGKLGLLRSVRKVIVQHKDVMSGETRKEYQVYEDFYIYDGKTMQRIKKDKSAVLDLLADQKTKIDDFVSANHLKMKSIDDTRKVIDYYNSL